MAGSAVFSVPHKCFDTRNCPAHIQGPNLPLIASSHSGSAKGPLWDLFFDLRFSKAHPLDKRAVTTLTARFCYVDLCRGDPSWSPAEPSEIHRPYCDINTDNPLALTGGDKPPPLHFLGYFAGPALTNKTIWNHAKSHEIPRPGELNKCLFVRLPIVKRQTNIHSQDLTTAW